MTGKRSAKTRLLSSERSYRVGLISPYSGGNLGNAAIISATIENIQKRIPGVAIVGITLNPDNTRRRHGIEAFPLAAVSRPYYSLAAPDSFGPPRRQVPGLSRIRQLLKAVPLLGRIVKALRMYRKEVAHVTGAAHVVRQLDQLIVPGGGALDEFWGGPWGHPWALFKWSVLSRVYRVPFSFISVGKCALERPLSRFFVRVALRIAKYRSYRDTDSKSAVESLIVAANDPVYPDLAFSTSYCARQKPPGVGSRSNQLLVGVSPIAYCDPRAWPRKDERRYTEYVSQLAGMVNWLLGQRHRILFFTTDGPDAQVIDDLRARIAGAPNTDAIQILPNSPEGSVERFLQEISLADMTIASRLHGVILSHLNATPVLAISFDPKVDAHMKAMGHQDYCLSIDHFHSEQLIDRFEVLERERDRERERLRSAALRFHRLLDSQYDRILGATYPVRQPSESRDELGRTFGLSSVGSSRAK